jgi:hypothetical protein
MAVKYGDVQIDDRKKLFLAIEGLPKNGKSTLALSAPDPIIIFDLDDGLKGVVDAAIEEGKKIIQPLNSDGTPEVFQHYGSDSGDAWAHTWKRFQECFFDALRHKKAKTIIVDTETEMYQLARMAHFGKLLQVKELFYGAVNGEIRKIIRRAKSSDKNIIFTRKLKSVYLGGDRTKEYVGAGFSEVDYEAEAVVRTWKGTRKDDGLFGFTFKLSRLNTKLEEEDDDMHELTGPMSTFPFLAVAVFPDTDPGDWE